MTERSFLESIKQNRLVLAVYLPVLIYSTCQGLLVPVLPLFAKELEISYGLVGLVVAGESLGMLLGDVPAGMMLRVFGKKFGMVLGLTISTLATIALFWLEIVPVVIFLRVLAGFGIALCNIAVHAYIAEAVRASNRGRSLALWGGTVRVGRLVGPAVGGIVAADYGLRTPFVVYGVACASAVIVVALFAQSLKRSSKVESIPGRSNGYHLVSTLKNNYRTLATAGSGFLFAQMVRAGRAIIIPLYASDVLGLDVDIIGYIVSISAILDLSLFFPAGLIMDRLGRKFSSVPCFALQGLGMMLVPLAGSATGLIIAASIMGIGNGLGSGAMLTLGADLAPPEERGEFLGVWRLIGDIGSSGGPLVVGAVADLFVLPIAAVVMATAGLVSAAILLLKVPETLQKRPGITGVG
jgi:MFS family permease